ncbi:MAG: AbrB/MazE/SpoVT family DNA-binding domain-containing protein [Capsulimonadaceae bacterium]
MSTFAKTRLIKIGKSHGIRIPKLLIDQLGLTGEVEIEAQAGQIVIRPARTARNGWDEQFQAMARVGDDRLMDGETMAATEWEAGEWEW